MIESAGVIPLQVNALRQVIPRYGRILLDFPRYLLVPYALDFVGWDPSPGRFMISISSVNGERLNACLEQDHLLKVLAEGN